MNRPYKGLFVGLYPGWGLKCGFVLVYRFFRFDSYVSDVCFLSKIWLEEGAEIPVVVVTFCVEATKVVSYLSIFHCFM